MAKNNKGNKATLSPEEYIKTRARKLPIHKCLINNDWKDSGIANVVLIRRHPQGTFTIGFYLVYIFCRGIYDSFYHFSIDEYELQDILDHLQNGYIEPIEEIDYVQVHNLVLGAEQYAEELGIKPCKEWNITQYLFDEDTDDIPLIEFEYGKNGRPFLCVKTGLEASRYIPLLNKSVGEGNYDRLFGIDNDVFDDGDDEDFDDEDYDDEDFDEDLGDDEYDSFEDNLLDAINAISDKYNLFDFSPVQQLIFLVAMMYEAENVKDISPAMKEFAALKEKENPEKLLEEIFDKFYKAWHSLVISLFDLQTRFYKDYVEKVNNIVLYTIWYEIAYMEISKITDSQALEYIKDTDKLSSILTLIETRIEEELEQRMEDFFKLYD